MRSMNWASWTSENFSLIINGIIPLEGRQNPLFAARAEMQPHYLVQIEMDFKYPRQTMTLLAGEIQGVKDCVKWARSSLTAKKVQEPIRY